MESTEKTSKGIHQNPSLFSVSSVVPLGLRPRYAESPCAWVANKYSPIEALQAHNLEKWEKCK